MPKISVIMPVYNSLKYLRDTIDSVLKQTYSDFEFIIVDDGSTDGSVLFLQQIEKENPRIKLICQENQGPSGARNTGVAQAEGEYIAFIDSDDTFLPQHLQVLIEGQKGLHADYIISGYKVVNYKEVDGRRKITDTSDVFGKKAFFKNKEEIKKNLTNLLKLDPLDKSPRIFNCTYSKLYRSKIIKDNQVSFPMDMSMGEDYLFNLAYLEFCDNLCILPEATYNYYMNSSSISVTYKENEFWMRKKSVDKTILFLKKQSMNYEAALFSYVGVAYSCFANLFLRTNTYTLEQKKQAIKKISDSDEIQDSLHLYKPQNLSQKISMSLLKIGSPTLLLGVGYVLYLIRKRG